MFCLLINTARENGSWGEESKGTQQQQRGLRLSFGLLPALFPPSCWADAQPLPLGRVWRGMQVPGTCQSAGKAQAKGESSWGSSLKSSSCKSPACCRAVINSLLITSGVVNASRAAALLQQRRQQGRDSPSWPSVKGSIWAVSALAHLY